MTPSKHFHRLHLAIYFTSMMALCNVAQADNENKQPTINITTEYFYPFNMSEKEGVIYGKSADKVHELFKRSQLPYQMTMMSWNRALELARNNVNTCVFSTVRNKERESSFQWIGPISTGSWSIFGHPDKLGKITQLEQVKKSTIGTEVGNMAVPFLKEKGFHVVTSNETITTFKNLAIGRIDYVATGAAHGKKMIIDNHLEGKVALLFDYGSSEYYLACNNKMNAETIALLNFKLSKMNEDGTVKNIDSKY